MWFQPESLSIITTHRCTAACAHCCFACSPARTEAIPLPRLRALIEETREVPSLAQVVFTGGECFLLGGNLDTLIGRCRELGLETRCVTNGSWAISPAAARARVARLREAGLGELNFSTGPHHAEWVPWERVAWGAAAAAEAGIRGIIIDVEAFEGSTFDTGALEGHPMLAPHVAAGRVRVVEAPWIPNGFDWVGNACASGPTSDPRYLRFQEGGRTACDGSLRTVSVTPELDLVTCCGLNLEHIPELHVASLRALTLREALESVPEGLLKMWIHVEGPERILEFVREKRPGFRLPLESAHICHTCRFLHGSREAMEVLAQHRQEVEARVLEKFMLAAAGRKIAAAL